MSQKVSVLTLEDGKDYVVLEQIKQESHDYLILFEDENPQNIVVAEFYSGKESYIELIEEDLKYQIIKEFFHRHPEFQK